MAMSAEARALRKSNAVFKSGVDPENLVTVLYSNFLLTLDEREKATHKQFTAGQQLEEMFTALERRVAVDPHVLQKLLDALNTEPALVPVAKKIHEIYDEEKAKGAANGGPTTSTSSNGDRGMRTPTQKELMDNVKVADWYPFALSLLNGDDQTVNTIDNDPSLRRIQDKLREVFKVWLKEESKEPTWNDVVAALKDVKNNRLARDIKTKYC